MMGIHPNDLGRIFLQNIERYDVQRILMCSVKEHFWSATFISGLQKPRST